jgi:hypothetical protein
MVDGVAPTSSGRTVGRYALFGEIASGGMAAVHFGRLVGPVGFSRTVAIKRLHAQFAKDPDFIAMFLDEARLVGRIRHPNVVPTLDVVQEAGEMLIVMEYVQGETLARLLRRCRAQNEAPPIPIVATVLVGVLHGLHAAHEARGASGEALDIVHRDVSPQNILVGTDGVPRILDFGIAKASQRTQTTRQGQMKGKLAYMAPEQVTSDRVDRRCDVFAAGVVLWETLTGKRLFEGPSDAGTLLNILSAPVPPPGSSAGLDAICLRALSRDPAARYPSARDMALAIERISPLAPASEAGAWVERHAHDDLAARAARVTEVESHSDVFVKPAPVVPAAAIQTAPPVSLLPRRPRRVQAVMAIGMVALVVVCVAAVGVTLAAANRRPSARQGDAPAVQAPSAAAPLPAGTGAASTGAAPTTVAQIPPSVQPLDAAPSPGALPRMAVPKTRVRPTAAPSTKTSGPDCSQPFSIDENGIRHVRAECL